MVDTSFNQLYYKGQQVKISSDLTSHTIILRKVQPRDTSKRLLDMRYKTNKEFVAMNNRNGFKKFKKKVAV